jgi:hypothetical protein
LSANPQRWAAAGLISGGTIALLIALFWLVPPIPQDPAYHLFADTRTLALVPNFWNVMSNLPFLVAGVFGWLYLANLPESPRRFARVYCTGLVLICFGSGWYHLAPDNASLVWDRLSMTVSFMAFFAFILSRVTSARTGEWLLWPLLGIGLMSVLYWYLGERAGAGDLRFYGVVQFLPGLLVPAFLLGMPERFTQSARGWLWLGLAAYVAAKLAEWQDQAIFDWSGWLSGHSLKHLLAALSSYYFLRVLLASSHSNQGQDT